MPQIASLNTFLHQSSLLIHAYPATRITTKYSLPRKPNLKSKVPAKSPPTTKETTTEQQQQQQTQTTREKKDPSATLTVKVFHPETGICLKYTTDKAQEVSRLIISLGKLAKGEIIELPATGGADDVGGAAGDKMDVDSGPAVAVKDSPADAVVAGKGAAQQQQPQQQQGGGKKKKKGKR